MEGSGAPGPAVPAHAPGVSARQVIARKGFAESVDVLLHDALATGVAALAEFLEQVTRDGAALGPPLVHVGVEDAGAARPLSDQELVRGGRVGEAADGVARQAEPTGDRPQPDAFVEQGMDGRVSLAHSIGQAA